MSKYSIWKFNLSEKQKLGLSLSIQNKQPYNFHLNKEQVLSAVKQEEELETFVLLPLTNRQNNMLLNAKKFNTDLILELHLLQISEIAKIMNNIDLDIDMSPYLQRNIIRRH